MTAEPLWKLVQAALDERRDPLADERVLAELEQQPEAFGAVEALTRDLALLGTAAPARTASRLRGPAWALVAAGALVAALIWSLPPEPANPSEPATLALGPAASTSAPRPGPGTAGRSRVVSCRVTVSRAAPSAATDPRRPAPLGPGQARATTTSEVRPGTLTRELRLEIQPPAPRSWGPLPLTTLIVRNQTRNQP